MTCCLDICSARPGCERHGSCSAFADSGEHVNTELRLCGDGVWRLPVTHFAGMPVYTDPSVPHGAPEFYIAKEPSMPAPNPKALRAVADGKAPLDYLEPACDDGEARVLRGGAIKYGRRNYRDTEMLWTTYLGAMRRHLNALARGEDTDPDSGEHHLYHIRANTAVLLGAMEAGTLRDDRLDKTSTQLSDRVHIDGDQDAKAAAAPQAPAGRACRLDGLPCPAGACGCPLGQCAHRKVVS